MKDKRYRFRIMLTVLCGLVAYCTFTLPPAPQSVSVKRSPDMTISTTYDNGAKFFEWVGLLFLALTVWIWRRELKLTGFGPLSGEPLEQQTPEEFRQDDSDTLIERAIPKDIEEAMSQMNLEEHEARKQRILDLFKKHHALNANIVARDLGVTVQTARALLFILMKEGSVRCDGFPRSALYTLTSSPENLALDHIRDIVQSETDLDSERRFVRVKHMHEIDGVFEAGNTTYVAEVKYIRHSFSLSKLDAWLLQLITVLKEFRGAHLIGILGLVVFDEAIIGKVQKIVRQLTYDTENIDLRILVLSKNLLEKEQNQTLQQPAANE